MFKLLVLEFNPYRVGIENMCIYTFFGVKIQNLDSFASTTLFSERAMLAGVACTALSTAALFWVRSVPAALLSRLLAGFGTALYSVARHAYVAGAVKSGSRGRAISVNGCCAP